MVVGFAAGGSTDTAARIYANKLSEAELQEIAVAWREWAADGDGWFLVPHGEVLCRP